MKILLQKISSTLTASIVFAILFAAPGNAATLSATTAQQQVYAGDTFAVEWFVDTQGRSINVIDAVLTYSAETLEVVELSTGVSAFGLWVQEPVVTRPGTIAFVGGVPAGIAGARVGVMRTVFRAKAPGTAAISLAAPSTFFYSDGTATAEALAMTPVVFDVLSSESAPYTIRSTTHPIETVWYQNRHVEIIFDVIEGEEYSYSFSTNAELIPDAVADSAAGRVVYDNVPDGVYYFTLASRAGGGQWHEARVFRVQIDTTAPEFIDASVAHDENMFDGKPFATFAATDKTSGIAGYAVKSGWFGMYKTATTPFELRRPLVGDTTSIKAMDMSGNVETTTVVFRGYGRPWIVSVAILVVLIISIFAVRRKQS